MIRALYSLLTVLAQPLLRRKLARRAQAEPGYAVAVEERFGHYSHAAGEDYVWVHAVSLGEARAAAILVAQLRERLPGMRLLLTHGTATGRAEGSRLLQAGDVQVWQPWDTPGAVARFLDRFRPRIGVLIETEVWPNLTAACAARGIPLALANARLNAQSLARAQRMGWLARPAYRALAAVWAQTDADAGRLAQLGAPVRGVFGNLKFDAMPDAQQHRRGRQWRAAFGRPVLLLASTRGGEEQQFLDIFKKKTPSAPVDRSKLAINSEAIGRLDAVQWLVVPRHPQRFDEVAARIEQAGFAVSRRSTWADGVPPSRTGDANAPSTVWLGDSLGEMATYYGLADVALLGGSFVPTGGQNLIEAAACGCPVVMGPSTYNFAEAAELSEAAGAALRVADLAQGMALALDVAGDAVRQRTMAHAAEAFALQHRGAAARTADALGALLAGAAAGARPPATTGPAAR
ncbi:MAG: 3-deoxy-D-manno-octulosonic acid transferase [Betaproteobacteria bacterium HGW-Betaproteobacteria-3]|nr:MAG: 3-deoxy-D-manno-octulosonic acid transferase [Betaproteobacteria bacterium HGW-Betaproteobacteria-3]